MPEPLEYQIIKDLQESLRAISIVSGFFHDVNRVAVKLDADAKIEELIGSSGLRPFIILEIETEIFQHFPSEQLRLRMPFTVHFVNDTDPTEDDDLLRSHLRASADIEKAISVDITRGKLAHETKIVGREKRDYEGQLIWSLISIEILNNRTYGEPNG
ncbi:MAG: hypothetical protein GY769_01790 [bacterium]|nr:hypothetical protein [bacterium]